MSILLQINWSSVGLQLGQLLLSLSILVILHEFGHFITARWFKCRVEKFYLFFDPWFSLAKKKVGDTEYGIGWLPLGGYVKISGMVDESMDKEQMKQPAQPWEFRSKPAWQRLIIMIGGVAVNVLLAIVIYCGIIYTWGERKIPQESLKYGVAINDSLLFDLGFKSGDKVLLVDEKPVDDMNEILKQLLLVEKDVTVERNGEKVVLAMPVDLIGKLVEKKKKAEGPLFSPRIPILITAATDTSNAFKIGMRNGDRVMKVDSMATEFYDQYSMAIANKKKGDSVTVTVDRAGAPLEIKTVMYSDAQVGFAAVNDPDVFDSLGIIKVETKKYSLLASIPAGFRRTGEELSFYMAQVKKIFSPSTGAYKGVGGFKAMGSVFSDKGWDWKHFWTITALFSVMLAFMNLLPIPALDGGHVLFTLIEMVTGRKPSEKFLEYAQIVGMILLFSLIIFANANDWFGWGR